MNCLRKLLFTALGVALIGSLAIVRGAQRKQDSEPQQQVFGGEYSGLNPDQKRLVDDWFRRLAEVLGKPILPEEGYDRVRLSVRTTFEAVTHALLRTPLTDQSGTALEPSALSLISQLDDVAGAVPGARGDKQFRIYAELVPGALGLLDKSQEFTRRSDNRVYHQGYPVCYRSRGGAPSIQISITKDGKFTDIDVDYRSAAFPAFLIDGHLSASNSDVRAGNNDQRHNRRWAGLKNWWRTLLGLRILEQPSAEAEAEGILPSNERIKPNAKPAEAVHDFLASWLVEQKPDESLAYIAESAFPCMELEQGRLVDRGMARFIMLKGLQEVNRRIGKVADLSEVVSGVQLSGPRVKTITQPYHAQFVLYDVREDLAERFKCANKLSPEHLSLKAAQSHKFGKYVGAVFKLKAGAESGETVATLWEKKKYWKLISYDVEPEFEALPSTAAAPPPKAPALVYAEGDKNMIRAAQKFYEDWFVRKRVDAAFRYVSPLGYSCANLYRSEETPEPKTPADEAELIRAGMMRIAEAAGSAKRLTDAIIAPSPTHPDIKLVRQRYSKAFVIASIPDYMAAGANCANRKPGEDMVFSVPPTGAKYGNYFATGFKMAKEVEDSGVLWTVWSKEAGQWKIISYALLTP